MVNFIWFSDDKLLMFYHCSHKNAQNDHSRALVVIAWLLHLSARQCTSTHCTRDGWVFWSRHAWFHAPMFLGADMMNIFLSVNQMKFTIKTG